MSSMHADLPSHILHRAQRVFRRARSKLTQERLNYLREAAAREAEEIRRAAQTLHDLADASYAGSRAIQTAKELDAVAGGLVQLSEDLKRPFLLFVVGMGKFGKSTLINALLGQRVAAMDALPKTWKIDVFTRTLPEGMAELRTYKGHVERMPVSEAVELIAVEEQRREESETKVWQLFQEQARKLSSVAEKELLRRELEMLHLYRSPIVEVKWPVRAEGISVHFDVVDTPGLWQKRLEMATPVFEGASGRSTGISTDANHFSLVSSEDLRSYYLQADGVLWMLDATKLATGKPHELLNDLNDALSRVGGVTRNAVAVLNRIDLVRRNGGAEAVSRVVDQARRLLAQLFQDVIPLSARESLEARETGDAQLLQQSGLPDLLAVIDQRFRNRGAAVRWWSKSEGRRQYLQQAREVGLRYRQELSAAEGRLREQAEKANHHWESLEQKARQRLSEALSQYQLDVGTRVRRHAQQVLSKEDNEREQYVRDELLRVEELKATLDTLLTEVRTEYRDTLGKLIPLQQFSTLRYAAPPPVPSSLSRLSLDDDLSDMYIDTSGLKVPSDFAIVGILSVLGASVLGPVGLVLGPVLFGPVQEFVTSYMSTKLEEQVRKQVRNMCREIQKQWSEAFAQLRRAHENRLRDIRERSFAQVHVSPSRLPAVRKTLQSLDSVTRLPEPTLRDVLLLPWTQQWRKQRALS